MELQLPLRNILVNQPFGVNFLNFYKNMGMLGHNGIDFEAKTGFECHASHAGKVIFAGKNPEDGGIYVEIWDAKQGCKTIYYHLLKVTVKVGDTVVAGQIIGICDNTGKLTTGDHLHFGFKYVDDRGNTLTHDNGYFGAIDPSPFFTRAYDGTPIKNKDWDKTNAYHRYFRKDGRNIKKEIEIRLALTKYLKWPASNEQVNMAVYGGWDRESIANPSMYTLCAYITKADYLRGKRPFID